jgi:DNA-binding beta-propeller fold protein YncE
LPITEPTTELYASLGTKGVSTSALDGFNTPTGLSEVVNNHIAICDTGNNRIQIYAVNQTLNFVRSIQGNGSNALSSPTDAAIFPNTSVIYVVDSQNARIQYFSLDGNYLGQFSGSLISPYRISIHLNGTIYVTDTGNSSLSNSTSGNGVPPRVLKFDLVGDSAGEFNITARITSSTERLGIAVTPWRMVISDITGKKVHIYMPTFGLEIEEIIFLLIQF